MHYAKLETEYREIINSGQIIQIIWLNEKTVSSFTIITFVFCSMMNFIKTLICIKITAIAIE